MIKLIKVDTGADCAPKHLALIIGRLWWHIRYWRFLGFSILVQLDWWFVFETVSGATTAASATAPPPAASAPFPSLFTLTVVVVAVAVFVVICVGIVLW